MKIRIKYILSVLLLLAVTVTVLELPQIYYFFSDSCQQKPYTSEEILLNEGDEDITPEKCILLLSSSDATMIEVTPPDETEIQLETVLDALSDLENFADLNKYSYFSELLNNITLNLKNFNMDSAHLFSVSGGVDNKPVSFMIWIVVLYSDNNFCSVILDDSTNMIYAFYITEPFSSDTFGDEDAVKEVSLNISNEVRNTMSDYWNIYVSEQNAFANFAELYINPDIPYFYETDYTYSKSD